MIYSFMQNYHFWYELGWIFQILISNGLIHAYTYIKSKHAVHT